VNTASLLLLSGLILLAVVTVSASVNILLRGRLYQRMKPQRRPRRWVLYSLLLLFAVFVVWFPVWMTWPHSLIARTLASTFAIFFGVVGVTLKWFTGPVDLFVEKRGWPLR
jgi:hypothetical protein